jgi:thymidylate synthase (FAD)
MSALATPATIAKDHPIWNEKKVLDHGFVRLVDYLGGDQLIVDSARISYAKLNNTDADGNTKLINYLMKNHHTSPFESVVFTFHVKMPLFVARQWVRHRTARLNEVSARYTELPSDFYIPEKWRAQSKVNKQGSVEGHGDAAWHEARSAILKNTCEANYKTYQNMLEDGVAREMARFVLPVNIYTECYWQMDLKNLFHFLKLRLDSHAQYEIQVYGQAMAQIVKTVVPLAYNAFEEHMLYAKTLSRTELDQIAEDMDELSGYRAADVAEDDERSVIDAPTLDAFGGTCTGIVDPQAKLDTSQARARRSSR